MVVLGEVCIGAMGVAGGCIAFGSSSTMAALSEGRKRTAAPRVAKRVAGPPLGLGASAVGAEFRVF